MSKEKCDKAWECWADQVFKRLALEGQIAEMLEGTKCPKAKAVLVMLEELRK